MANLSEPFNIDSDIEANSSKENDISSIESNVTTSSKRQAESDDTVVASKRTRKQTKKFGTDEYEKNDDE